VIDGGERIDLAPQGSVGLAGDSGWEYVAATVPVATVKRVADAKRVRIKALRLELELSESQRHAVGTFVDRVLSDNPAQIAR
jgi:hypothetical protein